MTQIDAASIDETKAQECHRLAAEAHQRAMSAASPSERDELLNMERRWLTLAQSYEFVGAIDRSLSASNEAA